MKNSPTQMLALVFLCLALLFPADVRAQQPRPQPPATPRPQPTVPRTQPTPRPTQSDEEEVIRLNTELVQLRAVVTDRKGQIVENLRKEDFEVFENNQPREISFFSVERTATLGATAQTPATTPGARTTIPTTGTARSATPSRVVVLFVDTLHLSSASLVRAKDQLKRFVDEQMTDADVAAVVATSGTLGALQQFMTDRRMLKYAIDKISLFARPHTSFTPYLAARVIHEEPAAINVALAILAAEEGYTSLSDVSARAYAIMRANQILTDESNLRRATLRTLSAVSERLASMRGQRIVAFVSDGFSLIDRGGGDDREDFSRATGSAARAGVLIYTLNAEGLMGPAEYTALNVPQSPAFSDFMSASRFDVQGTLREMASLTGGEAYINTNDMRGSLGKMLDSNRTYYSLAYYLPKDSDKSFRKIVVRVKNHPDYKVRTQKGYAPPPEKRADEVATTPRQKLFQAMIAPLPATAFGVISSADFLETASDDAQVTLQVHVDGERLRYETQGENRLLNCELAGVVFDKDGKIADQFAESFEATLTPQQFEQARRAGYRYSRRLKLQPGLYQVRVGVREVGSELTGTSASWVEVPDLSKTSLALSSLFLGERQAGAQNDPHARAKLAVGNASIKSGEVILYRFVAYDTTGAQSDAGATMKVDILQGGKFVYQGNWQPLTARTIRKDAKGTESGGELRPTLPPGVYTLRVTVKNGAKKSAQREADFEIES